MLRTLVAQSRLALGVRCLSVSAINRVNAQAFEEAQKLVTTLSEEPGNDVKLKLYGLYKQSTDGKCTKGKPGAMDFIGRAKWDAWNSLGAMTKDAAREQYVTLVYKLAGKAPPSSGATQAKAAEAAPVASKAASGQAQVSGGEILSSLDERGVFRLTFNRPAKFNALTMNMYKTFAEQLEKAAQDDNVHFTVIRGAGSYFTAGNDLANFASAGSEGGNLLEALASRFPTIRRFIYALIEHPKVLVAAVNGPAIGVGATMLAHCDFVYAAKSAWLSTPFLKLGLVPEAASSYVFPRALGPSLAKRMLILGEQMPVTKLAHTGLITEVVEDAELDAVVEKRVAELAEMPKFSLRMTKQLTRTDVKEMKRVADLEFQTIAEGFQRPEVVSGAIQAFVKLQSKKKN